jgi:murein DD-endopeptidase MepM/ murein hydrolase activator NlpD
MSRLLKIIKLSRTNLKGFFKNPIFYFGLISAFLFMLILFSSDGLAISGGQVDSKIVFFNSFFDNSSNLNKNNLFYSQISGLALETPDLKITQDNYLYGISTPRVLTPKVLGDVFGGPSQDRRDIIEYAIQPGDTLEAISRNYGISLNTLLWANDLTSSSKIKVGQTLVILPTDGLLHIVKSGDTISSIGQKYGAKTKDIVAFNDLENEDDIYIGDILIVPDGVMPKKAVPLINIQTSLADNFFILPTEGKISQGLHFFNAIDIANKCGTPVYAAASGQVQRVKYGYNFGGGNTISILHSSGITTSYGHVQISFVKPGDKVNVGDRIALIGGAPGTAGAGISTGCHLHFGVTGAKNPLAKYGVGTTITLK